MLYLKLFKTAWSVAGEDWLHQAGQLRFLDGGQLACWVSFSFAIIGSRNSMARDLATNFEKGLLPFA